jgi:hypothetical protein
MHTRELLLPARPRLSPRDPRSQPSLQRRCGSRQKRKASVSFSAARDGSHDSMASDFGGELTQLRAELESLEKVGRHGSSEALPAEPACADLHTAGTVAPPKRLERARNPQRGDRVAVTAHPLYPAPAAAASLQAIAVVNGLAAEFDINSAMGSVRRVRRDAQGEQQRMEELRQSKPERVLPSSLRPTTMPLC